MKRSVALGLALACGQLAFAQSGATQQLHDARAHGLASFLLVSFLGGLAALLTPCVFPMVPVTISYFTKRETNIVASAISYCFGIVATFAVLGIGASVIFGATGIARFAANPIVNLVLAAVFILLALNLFGLFELKIRLPAMLAKASRPGSKGLAAPFFMGMAFSMTSFTCTAPIAGGLLTMSAAGGIAYPAAGMAAFGLAFCLPFLVLALSPSMLSKLPKSGNWLGAVKPALAFIELAAAVKFISNADLAWQLGLLKRPEFLAAWAVIALGLGLYLLGIPTTIAKTGWSRRSLGILSLGLTVFFAMGMTGKSVGVVDAYLPPSPYPTDKPAARATPEDVVFLKRYDDAVAKAKSSGRNIFVDFTGVTCTNCRWMEDNIFVLDPVKRLLSRMVTVQLYTDRPNADDQANQKLQQKIGGTIALPVYVIVTPDGKVLDKFEGKSSNPEEFEKFLKSGAPDAVASL